MATNQEEVLMRLGFATDQFDRDVRQLKSSMGETADRISDHFDRAALSGRRFHMLLGQIEKISPAVGLALTGAFSLPMLGVQALILGVEKLREHFKESQKESEAAMKAASAAQNELDKAFRNAQKTAEQTVRERKKQREHFQDSLVDEKDPILSNLDKQKEALKENAKVRKEAEADSRKAAAEKLREEERSINDLERAIRERYSTEKTLQERAYQDQERAIHDRYRLQESRLPHGDVAQREGLHRREESELGALRVSHEQAQDESGGSERAELDSLTNRRRDLSLNLERTQLEEVRAERLSEERDRAEERALALSAIEALTKEEASVQARLDKASVASEDIQAQKKIDDKAERLKLLAAQHDKLQKKVEEAEPDKIKAEAALGARASGLAKLTEDPLMLFDPEKAQAKIQAYNQAKAALDANKLAQDETLKSSIELKEADDQRVESVRKLEAQLKSLTSAHRALRAELDRSPAGPLIGKSGDSSGKPGMAASGTGASDAASGLAFVPGENWAARSQRIARMSAEDRARAEANLPHLSDADLAMLGLPARGTGRVPELPEFKSPFQEPEVLRAKEITKNYASPTGRAETTHLLAEQMRPELESERAGNWALSLPAFMKPMFGQGIKADIGQQKPQIDTHLISMKESLVELLALAESRGLKIQPQMAE